MKTKHYVCSADVYAVSCIKEAEHVSVDVSEWNRLAKAELSLRLYSEDIKNDARFKTVKVEKIFTASEFHLRLCRLFRIPLYSCDMGYIIPRDFAYPLIDLGVKLKRRK